MGKPSDGLGADRYRSWARQHAAEPSLPDPNDDTILPSNNEKANITKTGGLNNKEDGRGSPSGSTALKQHGDGGSKPAEGGGGDYFSGAEKSASNDTEASAVKSKSAAAPPALKSENEGTGDTALTASDSTAPKPPIPTRMLNGSKRFFAHMKDAICHSWINVLLVFVPVGIIVAAIDINPGITFGMNAVAIIPLAGLLAYATESVASRLGDTLGALLNVSFGNAVELIIFIIALVKDEIDIVQAALLGSILANLLLILGMAFLFGGLRYREQVYNSTVTQMSACLLSLSVMSLLLPTAFYASFAKSSASLAQTQVLKVSRGTSVVLLLVYILYLTFQLKTHAYMYESTPQEVIDEESHPGILADLINSSSSSDTSSTSDSTDSDTSGSGSIAKAGTKMKRMFRNRRRRKSSTSTTTGSAEHSALSSPATTERQAGNYWESQGTSKNASRRGSMLGAIASGDEADADEANVRVRDFVRADTSATAGSSKSPERKKHRKKHQKRKEKKAGKKQKAADDIAAAVHEPTILDQPTVQTPAKEEPKEVGFSDDVQVMNNPAPGMHSGRSTLNMRSLTRPALPKMFTQNVFTEPAPVPQPAQRPALRPSAPSRAQSSGTHLRRTSSLPGRLNENISQTPSRGQQPQSFVYRNDPLPPFQHRARQALRKIQSEEENDSNADEDEKKPEMSRTAAVVLLLCTTGLVAVCAEFMVDAIPDMIASSPSVSQAFIGLIILPIVGNAAEHATAVTVAAKNKMDLAIGVAVGSSIQIALFVTPIVVLLGWILHTDMSLYFNIFETISLFVTAFVVNFLVLDGRSNYLEGSLLCAAYVIIALGAFFYPDAGHQSSFGSVGGGAA